MAHVMAFPSKESSQGESMLGGYAVCRRLSKGVTLIQVDNFSS